MHPDRTLREIAADQRGSAMVELALVSGLLLLLLFGIISYGIVLSFKQSMTQVAADAARAGAVAGTDASESVAVETLEGSGNSTLDRTCTAGDDDDGLTCTASCIDSDDDPVPCDDDAAGARRLVIEVTFDGDDAERPLVPPFPLLSAVLPDTLTSRSVVRISGT